MLFKLTILTIRIQETKRSFRLNRQIYSALTILATSYGLSKEYCIKVIPIFVKLHSCLLTVKNILT